MVNETNARIFHAVYAIIWDDTWGFLDSRVFAEMLREPGEGIFIYFPGRGSCLYIRAIPGVFTPTYCMCI